MNKYLFSIIAVLMLLASTALAQPVYTGTISETVTLSDGANITLNNATITGGIICEGNATITLVGNNNVTGKYYYAGVQVGGSGTTLTIKGDGSLTATGGDYGAGIGTDGIYHQDATGGNIVIESGTIIAQGGFGGAGIGTGLAYTYSTKPPVTKHMGDIVIKGGIITAIGGDYGVIVADGIGCGIASNYGTTIVDNIIIYDGITKVEASRIGKSPVFMHETTDVTANKSDYFAIIEDGDRRVIASKDNTDYTITLVGGTEHGTISCAETAKYMDKVTVTATPNFGYRLSRLVVKDAQNNDVASTGNSFFMPKSNVTISAVFEQGSHGTTEFKWVYNTGDGPDSNVEETIYDGVTTVNLQQEGFSKIMNAGYDDLRIDNDEYNVSIPYSGGTGTFENVGTNFALRYDATAGFYDITMTDAGNGKWNVSILKTAGQMDVVPDQTYTGSEIKPEPLVMAGSLNLTKGTDYEYSYTDNVNVGTATVRATFKGTYASLGYVEKTFTINPRVTISGALTLTEYGNRTTAEIQGDFTTSSEGKSLDISTPIPVNKVIFKRSFTKGIPATIMLPFGFTPDGDNIGSFYTLESVECKNGEWIATMSGAVTYVEANKPYIFKSAVEELNEMSFEDEDKDDDEVGITLQPTSDIKENPNGDWTLHGVYEKTMLYGNGQINYGFAGKDVTADGISVGDFIRAGEGVWADPMRCYLTYKDGELTTKAATVLPDRIRVVFPDEENSNNETTDIIENTETEDVVTPVSEISSESGAKVWSFDGTIYIEAQPDMDYTIVDLTGRTIKKGVTHSTHEEVTLNAKGIVIVKIGNKSFKIK